MESEKFNPDATCGFRMSEPYLEESIVNKIYYMAWDMFTDRSPEYVEFKFLVLNLMYKADKKSGKVPVTNYINRNCSPINVPEIKSENLFEYERDMKKMARKIDLSNFPLKVIAKFLSANPNLISDPTMSFLYILGIEKARLGDRKLLNAFILSEDEYKEKKIPNSMLVFLYWGVEGLLESLDRITNHPDKESLSAGIIKPHLNEELFFKLLISHPPIKKIALQQTWIILQNEGFDLDPNLITKKINATPLRKEILSKEAYKKMHTNYKQLHSLDNFREFLKTSEKRLAKWGYRIAIS